MDAAALAAFLAPYRNNGADADCRRYGHNAEPGDCCPHCGHIVPEEAR